MSDKTDKLLTGFKKEKKKWIVVTLLSPILLFVLYYNIMLSKNGDTAVRVQEQKVKAVDYSIQLPTIKELLRSLATADEEDETSEGIRPLMITDLFSFGSRSDLQNQEAVELPEEKEDFVLKGTIIDGENSVVYINEQVLGIGDTIHGFTVVSIHDAKAVIRNDKEEITVLLEDRFDEML